MSPAAPDGSIPRTGPFLAEGTTISPGAARPVWRPGGTSGCSSQHSEDRRHATASFPSAGR